MEAYRDTPLAQSLRFALASIPYNDVYDHHYEQLVFKILYFAISNGSRDYDRLFSRVKDFSDYPQTWEDVFSKGRCNDIFYKQQHNHKSKGHAGKICACKIPDGRLVYNCYDCGVDATCCMCEDCFNKEEHSDHNVSVHSAFGGAICDCGDKSSWKLDLVCNAAESEKNYLKKIKPISSDLSNVISIVIKTIFDYLIDINVTSVQTISKLTKDNDYENFDRFINMSNLNTLPSDAYGINDKQPIVEDEYHLLVWNDEFHNVDEAIELIKAGSLSNEVYREYDHNSSPLINEDPEKFAESQATYIDAYGVTSLAQVKIDDARKLLKAMEKMNYLNDDKVGLSTGIVSRREFIRLLVSRYCFNWLVEVMKNDNWNVVNCIQDEITNCLLEQANISHDFNLTADLEKSYALLDSHFRIPLLKGVYLDNIGNKSYIDLNKLNFQEVLNSIDINNEPIDYQSSYGTRLQYLMFLELRFPKKLRKILKNTIISLVTSTTQNRFKYAEQIMTILPTLEYLNFKYDREYDLSLLGSYRLQVYHDPNIGTQLLKQGNLLENILSSCLFILSFSVKNGKYYVSEDSSWVANKRRYITKDILMSLTTILGFIHKGCDEIFYQSFFLKIIIWLDVFDEVFQLKRKTGSHIEYQNHSICNAYHSQASRVYELAELFGKFAFNIDERNHHLEESITILSSYLKLKDRKYSDDGSIVQFDVTDDGATMIHPLLSLLGELIKGYKFFKPELIQRTIKHVHLLNGCVTFDEENIESRFLGVADEALQPFVYYSQIISNFWVRNGDDVRIAERYFTQVFNPDSTLHIIQQGILTNSLPLDDILDRFLFRECFENGEEFDKSIYSERASNILTDMIQLFFQLFAYRFPFDSEKSFEKYSEYKSIIQLASIIGMEPAKYSYIKKQFGNSVDLDDLLDKIADYVPPTSYNDYGKYKLNKSCLGFYDPYDIWNNKNSGESIEECLLEQMADDLNKKIEDLVLVPRVYNLNDEDRRKFKPISDFFKSKEMVKFIYKILSFAINSDNDSHLNITLHLIHAIVIDDGGEGLENFINIPICNLLMGTVEKQEVSKLVAKKASTILELLLLKDEAIMESLIDCFGEAKIDEYKKSKHGKNFETKMERSKRLALKRQKKIMKKMQKQQTMFVDKNSALFDNDYDDQGNVIQKNSDDNDVNMNDSKNLYDKNLEARVEEIRACILCKNPENDEEIFGVPGNVVASSVFWKIPTINDKAPKFMIDDQFSQFEPTSDNQGAHCATEKPIIFGCPHGMHYECFLKMIRDKQQKHDNFQCPLCEGTFNVFIPSMKMKNFDFDLSSYGDSIKIIDILNPNSNNGQNISPISIFTKDFVHELNNPEGKSYTRIIKQANSFSSKNLSIFTSSPFYQTCNSMETFQNGKFLTFGISNIIGNSLESFEILSRNNSGPVSSTVLPELQLRLLRSLIQYRALLNYNDKYQLDETRLKYFASYLNDPNMGFLQSILLLFFEGGLQLEDIIKFISIKIMSNVCLSVMQRSKQSPDNLKIDSILQHVDLNNIFEAHTNGKLTSAGSGLENVLKNFGEVDQIDREVLTVAYRILKTNFQHYQTQLGLLSQLLNAHEDLRLPNTELILESFNNEMDFNFKLLIKFIPGSDCELYEDDIFVYERASTDIVDIDYPSNIKLTDLPQKLKELVNADMMNNKSHKTDLFCLNCGSFVKQGTSVATHVHECPMNRVSVLIFNPMKNLLKIHFTAAMLSDNSPIESPYLNKHGEPSHGIVGFGDSGTLNLKRYEHLQKVYFDQTLYQSISRKSGTGITSFIRRTVGATVGFIDSLHFAGIRGPRRGVNASRPNAREVFLNTFMREGRLDPRIAQMFNNGWAFENGPDDDEYDENGVESMDENDSDGDEFAFDRDGNLVLANETDEGSDEEMRDMWDVDNGEPVWLETGENNESDDGAERVPMQEIEEAQGRTELESSSDSDEWADAQMGADIIW